MTRVKFTDLGTFEGVKEWAIVNSNGDWVGTITRERPFRAFGRRLTTRDASKPYIWGLTINDVDFDIPSGSTIAQVKAFVLQILG
jgi:hypothetical protein